MAISSSRQVFLKSDKALELREALVAMVKSSDYNTHLYSMFSDSDDYNFVEKHMQYMSNHPLMDHWQYVLNLKLMTKIKK
jgi:hypothetical protein